MRNRGMFGYEGEGFDRARDAAPPRGYSDLESGVDRGWNIGSASDRPSYRGRGPKNYRRSDDAIRDDVCERLTMDDEVDASEIEVRVQDCVVTLSGTVNDRFSKRRAEDVADSVRGVTDVQNELRVSRPEQNG